jgi:SOS-response transcriptional repressor LexA
MAFSWNSELPSGRNPFWIRDEALSGINLHSGDLVGVDTRADPNSGDLVVAEVELDDDSLRLARRYVELDGGRVRLEPVGGSMEPIEVARDQVMVMGVVASRLRISEGEAVEEPLVGD